jgi:Domain of unknown function (DUF6602)
VGDELPCAADASGIDELDRGHRDQTALIRTYFRSKKMQLTALAAQAIMPHNPSIGSHREELSRLYLSDVLPRRYAVHTGMIFGTSHRSKQIDIVIWDHLNYPIIPMLDHAVFFAESVHAAIEVKSRWSLSAARAMWENCRSVRAITLQQPIIGLPERIRALEHAFESYVSGHGSIKAKFHFPGKIPTIAIFLTGGKELDEKAFSRFCTNKSPEQGWPDLALLLEANLVIEKRLPSAAGIEALSGQVYPAEVVATDYGEDALAVFTARFLRIVSSRSEDLERGDYLHEYIEAEHAETVFRHAYETTGLANPLYQYFDDRYNFTIRMTDAPEDDPGITI